MRLSVYNKNIRLLKPDIAFDRELSRPEGIAAGVRAL